MILVECDSCGRRELRGYKSVRLANTPAGIELSFTCRGCGAARVEYLGVHAGSPAPSPAPGPAPSPVAA